MKTIYVHLVLHSVLCTTMWIYIHTWKPDRNSIAPSCNTTVTKKDRHLFFLMVGHLLTARRRENSKKNKTFRLIKSLFKFDYWYVVIFLFTKTSNLIFRILTFLLQCDSYFCGSNPYKHYMLKVFTKVCK